VSLVVIAAALFWIVPRGYAEELIRDETGQVPWEIGGWGPGYQSKNAAIDIDGEVGRELKVDGLHAICKTDAEFKVPWTASFDIVSGTLPPGLTLNNDSTISGIPRERGHWVVIMKVSNIHNVCGHADTPGFTQELRFHITGSGKVIK
jgi:hypothetical protein